MTTWDELERRKWLPAVPAFNRSNYAVVLSLVSSLALVAIISKNHVVNSLWIDIVAFGAPIPVALYFERRIVRFGVLACVMAIVVPLGAAILFGI